MIKGIPAAPAKIIEHFRVGAFFTEHLLLSCEGQCFFHRPFAAQIRIASCRQDKAQIIRRRFIYTIGSCGDAQFLPVSRNICTVFFPAYGKHCQIFPSGTGTRFLLRQKKLRTFGDIPEAGRKCRPYPPVLMLINSHQPSCPFQRHPVRNTFCRIQMCLRPEERFFRLLKRMKEYRRLFLLTDFQGSSYFIRRLRTQEDTYPSLCLQNRCFFLIDYNGAFFSFFLNKHIRSPCLLRVFTK